MNEERLSIEEVLAHFGYERETPEYKSGTRGVRVKEELEKTAQDLTRIISEYAEQQGKFGHRIRFSIDFDANYPEMVLSFEVLANCAKCYGLVAIRSEVIII